MDRKPKILIVDDDPDFVEVTSRILRVRPYQVTVAYNGEEGVKKIREQKPDLILLDIMMPKKDGFIVADELSRDPTISEIPILAITSFVDYTGQPFPFKVSEYLSKGIKPDDLHKLVEKQLKRLGFFADQPQPPDIFPIPEKKAKG
jgi:two-component system, OmpR family, alkaline phosphatase synthesis response regulator PhoP